MRTRTRETPLFLKTNYVSNKTSVTNGGSCHGVNFKVFKGPEEVISHYGGFQTGTVRAKVVETVTEVLTPNFLARKKAGEILPTTPLVLDKAFLLEDSHETGRRFVDFSYHACQPKDRQEYRFAFSSGVNWIRTRPGLYHHYYVMDKNWANDLKVLAKARLHSQGWDVLTFATEFHKTLAMIGSVKRNLVKSVEGVIKTIQRDIRQYRRYKKVPGWIRKKYGKKFPFPRTPTEAFDLFSQYWLEVRFGWRILMYDMQSLDEWLTNKAEKERLIVGRFRDTRQITFQTGDRTTEYTNQLHVGYPGMLDPAVLGYANPLNTLWDTMLFTLVVDWFFNVQETILAHTSAPANVRALPQASFLTYTSSGISQIWPKERRAMAFSNELTPLTYHTSRKTREWIGDPKLSWPSFAGGPQGYQRLDLTVLLKPIYKALLVR